MKLGNSNKTTLGKTPLNANSEELKESSPNF